MVRPEDGLRQVRGRTGEVLRNHGRIDRRQLCRKDGVRARTVNTDGRGELHERVRRVGLHLAKLVAACLDRNKDVEEVDDVLERVALVKGDGDVVLVDAAEVDVVLDGVLVQDRRGRSGQADGQVVEVGLVDDFVTEARESSRRDARKAVHLFGDLAETFGAVVHRVHGRDVGEQSLQGREQSISLADA